VRNVSAEVKCSKSWRVTLCPFEDLEKLKQLYGKKGVLVTFGELKLESPETGLF